MIKAKFKGIQGFTVFEDRREMYAAMQADTSLSLAWYYEDRRGKTEPAVETLVQMSTNEDKQLYTALVHRHVEFRQGIKKELRRLGITAAPTQEDIEITRIAMYGDQPFGTTALADLDIMPKDEQGVDICIYPESWAYFLFVVQSTLIDTGFTAMEVSKLMQNESVATYN